TGTTNPTTGGGGTGTTPTDPSTGTGTGGTDHGTGPTTGTGSGSVEAGGGNTGTGTTNPTTGGGGTGTTPTDPSTGTGTGGTDHGADPTTGSGSVEAGGGNTGSGSTNPTTGGGGTGSGSTPTDPSTGTETGGTDHGTDPTTGTGSGGVEAGGGNTGTGSTDPTTGSGGTGTTPTDPSTGTGTGGTDHGTDPTTGTGSGGVEAGGGNTGTGTTDPTTGSGGTGSGSTPIDPSTGTGTGGTDHGTDPTTGTGSGRVEAGGGNTGSGTTDPTTGSGGTGATPTDPSTGTGTGGTGHGTDPTTSTGSGGVEAGGGNTGTGTTDPTTGSGGTDTSPTDPSTGTGGTDHGTDPTTGTGSGGVEAGGGNTGSGATDPTTGSGGTGTTPTDPSTGTGGTGHGTDPTTGTGSGGVEAGGGNPGTGSTDPTTGSGGSGSTPTDPSTGTGGTDHGTDPTTGTGSGGVEAGGGNTGSGATDPTTVGGGTGSGSTPTDPSTGTGGTDPGTGTGSGGTTDPGTGGHTDPGTGASISLTLSPALGLEDHSIGVSISVGLPTSGASGTVSVTIDGVPAGATLSAGIDNHDGTWTLTGDQLVGLTLTPPTDYSGTLNLGVTAHAALDGTDISATGSLAVTVAPVADAPTLTILPAVGLEDQPIALTIAAGLHAPADGETLSVTIAGVPVGATLSAGTDNGDGSWTLTGAQLTGLTITPPTDYSGTLTLSVTAHAEVGGTSADTTGSLAVTVAPMADAPTLTILPSVGLEDQPIALTIAAGLHAPADGETLSVTIAGVPAGATLSAGTDNGDGTWTLTGAQLTGLTITPPADYSGTLNLSVTAHAEVGGTSADTTGSLAVTVAPVADAPTLAILPAVGLEDQPIALTIAAGLHAPADGETLSVTIAGVPAGATLSAGTDNGDGTWTLTGAQLTGLTITPPADYSGTLTLSVTAEAAVNGTTADTTGTLSITVAPVADAPVLSLQASVGHEDQPIALSISASLVDPAQGETLSVTVAGVPAGAHLSAGVDNHDGTWTLSAGQLTGLTLTPPADYSGTLTLSVTAHAEVGGTSADTTGTLAVTVDPDTVHVGVGIDAPGLTLLPAIGLEDQPIALTIATNLPNPLAGETLSVTISGLPAGATLSAGTDNGDGTWTLTAVQLTGLTITPPADYSGTLTLGVTAHAELAGVEATTSANLAVTVTPVAHAPTLAVLPAIGLEDQPIALTIGAGLVAPAAGETLSVTIAGVPVGAILSAGTDNHDGTWTLTGVQLTGLTLTPPADFNGTLALSVTAHAEVAGVETTTSGSLTVTVLPVADAPTLAVLPAIGLEDQPIALTIAAGLVAPADGETLSVTIAGVPVGATLSAGTDNHDGTWTLTGVQLTGLTITPPADYSGTLTLSVTAHAEVGGLEATTSASLAVTVAPVDVSIGAGASIEAPSLVVLPAVGLEDQPIALTLAAGLTAPVAGETLHVTISGLPAGATLSAGTDNHDGTWTLTAAQLTGLTLTPPADYNGTLALNVTAHADVGGLEATTSASLAVTVTPVADMPSLAVLPAVGLEDQPIALSIAAGLAAPAAGETLSVTIAGVPVGATLSAGTDNHDGTWTLTTAQLTGLTLTPPADYNGTVTLTVTAHAEVNGTSADASGSLSVTVLPVADAPSLVTLPAVGLEDQPIALTIAAGLHTPADGETLSITIAGVPAGATLSTGTDNHDGTWTLTTAQLTGLTLTPPADYNGTVTLTVTAHADANGTTADTTGSVSVSVLPVADVPNLVVLPTVGLEDQPIALTIAAGLASPAAGETLSVVISGVPVGATLSAGTDNHDGTWTLTGVQLTGLTITPPADYSGALNLTVTAHADVNGTEATASATVAITVLPVADVPNLVVLPAVGLEDQPIALTIGAGLATPATGETLSVVVSGVPVGATLSAGTDNHDGTWTLTGAQLSGLTLTPPADYSGTLNLTVTAHADVNGTEATVSGGLAVTVLPVADVPNVVALPAVGLEDQPIALTIAAGLTTPAAGETLSVVVGGVPVGATLSAGTDNHDGTWTLTGVQLTGLTITPPADYSGTLNLTVTAHADVNGTEATANAAVAVTVLPVADIPNLVVLPAVGLEDQPIALNIAAGLTTPAAGETLSVVVSGVPTGAVLSAGTDNHDGTWTLTGVQLTGLTLTPPADYNGTLNLTVTAHADVNGTEATVSGSLSVTVLPVADIPNLVALPAVGLEDQPIALSIGASLATPVAGETLSVVVGGVPVGASLSAGTDNHDGTWTLTAAQLTGLTITPPADYSGTLNLTVTAHADVNGTEATANAAIAVTVLPVADVPNLVALPVVGLEDQPIALNISAGLAAPVAGEALSVVVSGVPTGAVLSAGTDNHDGTWTLTGVQLTGLTITPPADYNGTITLGVTAHADVNGTAASVSTGLTVTVLPVADIPNLVVLPAVGLEDQPIALTIGASLATPAAGETLTVTVSGLPAGAVLSAGTDNHDGTWTLTGAQLTGLTLTPPADYHGTLTLGVTAHADVNGTDAAISATVAVTVLPVADIPNLAVLPVVGLEDHPIALTITAGLAAPVSAGETLSVTVAGLPAGASLSAGTDNHDGTWTLTSAQLTGVTLTPPADYHGSLNLTVTAHADLNGTDATASANLAVTVLPVADIPNLVVLPTVGLEDQPIALNIAASLTAPVSVGESLTVTVAGLPAGAILSAGTDNHDGTWTLTGVQLSGLTVTPPADYNGTLNLTVTAHADVNGTEATASANLAVTVLPVADIPNLVTLPVVGLEDQPIALNITAGLASPAAGETLSVVVSGVPAGATLSAGTDNHDGTWTLTGAQLTGLTLTPPADYSGTLNLAVTAHADVNGTEASANIGLAVTVLPVADIPNLVALPVVGLEDQPIALTIAAGLTAPVAGETLSVTISGLPAGATLSAGTDNHDGTWTLTTAQLTGLTLTPPADYHGTLNLSVTAHADVNGTEATASATVAVTVLPVADIPNLAVLPVVGLEDQPVALTIAAGLVAPVAGETLSVTIAGMPAGATLSAGTDNHDGTWTLTTAQLTGLTLTPPADYHGTLSLAVTAHADVNGTEATASATVAVTVLPVADVPNLVVLPVVGLEDQPIALTITAGIATPAVGETLSVVVGGLPAGATLSAGTDNHDGTWTLTGAQLTGLTLTPPHDYHGTLNLTVTAHADLNGTEASVGASLAVTVVPVADVPNLAVLPVVGLEHQPIALNIAAGIAAPAPGETLTVTVSGVPVGATLSAGTDNHDGTWTLTGAQLSGITLTPPADYHGTLSLGITAHATLAGVEATTNASLSVTVLPVADIPNLAVLPVVGLEDHPIALTITAGIATPAVGETLSVVVTGVPVGATLSAGTHNADGTWTLTGAQLTGLTLTPPADYHGTITLGVTAHADLAGAQASVSANLAVTVLPVAEVPNLVALPVVGLEDQPIALTIAAGLPTPLAGETLSVVVGGLPAGATLSAGTHNGDGTWTLTSAQLTGLTVTPPHDYNGTLNLTVTAHADLNGTEATASANLTVTVLPVADIPTLAVLPTVGLENQPIALTIGAGLVAPALGETLSVVVSGVPVGATLSAGTHNSDGTWTLTGGQLTGLTLTPPADYTGSLTLGITAHADINGTDAAISANLAVTVLPVATIPTLVVLPVAGLESQPVSLNISAGLVSPVVGETLSVVVSGVPAGATLSAGTNNHDGTWTVTGAQLTGLTLTPPANYHGTLDLTVTAHAGLNGTDAVASAHLSVNVLQVADIPTVAVLPAVGLENQPVALNLTAGLAAPVAGESLSVVVSGLPLGATLSAGTHNADGTWTLTGAQLTGLTLTPPHDYSGSLNLTVTAHAGLNGTDATASANLAVTVLPVADVPNLVTLPVVGLENQPVALNITAGLATPVVGEALSVVISGVPVGATLSAGTHNSDGTWTLTAAQLTGLSITPPHDYHGTLNLTVAAHASLNGTDAVASANVAVNILQIADVPTLAVLPAVGLENQPVALSLTAGLAAPVAGETLSVVVTGVPVGATLSAGTHNADGSWTLTGAQLTGLTLTPPANYHGTLDLTVTAHAGLNGTDAAASAHLSVNVLQVADIPTLVTLPAVGLENQPVALSLTAGLATPVVGETLSVVVTGVPVGATLSAGTHNADGTWTLTGAQLTGLSITPPANYHGTLNLGVTAHAGLNGTDATASATVAVTVLQVADIPTLVTLPAVGLENQPVALSLTAGLAAPVVGETLSVVVTGVPVGATLSAGTHNADGSWTLTSAQLSGLTLTPPANYHGTLNLTVTAHAGLNGTDATASANLAVNVLQVADIPTVTVLPALGLENHAIALTLGAGLLAPVVGETLSVVVTGVPAGATLSAGTHNADGSWTLTGAQLSGLTLTPPANYHGTLNLAVTAHAGLNGTDAAASASMGVTVLPVADVPNLNLGTSLGLENQPISLNLATSLPEAITGETLAVTISGLPLGATLNHGVLQLDGSYLLTPAQLAGLTITPPANYTGTLTLSVDAHTSVNGTSADATGSLSVTVLATTQAPTLAVAAAVGLEDRPVALTIATSLVASVAGETLSVTLTGVPAGATLSAGIHNADGSWTLTGAQLSGLTLTPPTNYSGTLSLGVTAHAALGSVESTTSAVLPVTVTAVADTPHLAVLPANGLEDRAVPLTIMGSLTDTDGSEVMSIVVSGLPLGATLNHGILQLDGSYLLTPAQLSGLTVTPPTNYSGTFNLTVTAHGTETSNLNDAATSLILPVTVAGVADTPTLVMTPALGVANATIPLVVAPVLGDTDGSEQLSVTVSGVPAGGTLNHGQLTAVLANGTTVWSLSPSDLSGLTLTPPHNYSGMLNLTVNAIATETGSGSTASVSGTLGVTVLGSLGVPNLLHSDVSVSLGAAVGVQGTATALDLTTGLSAAASVSDLNSVVVSGLPAGASLNHGILQLDGSYLLTPSQLTGLTITTPSSYSGSFNLNVSYGVGVGAQAETVGGTLGVQVAAVANVGSVVTSAVSGLYHTALGLNVVGSLLDTVGTQQQSYIIGGVPNGAHLSAGINNGDGTWTVLPSQITGLTVTPPISYSGTMNLTVTEVARDANGSVAVSATQPLAVTVASEVVGALTGLLLTPVHGLEDTAITLGTSLVSLNLLGAASVTIAGVPAGATLSGGTKNSDGTWTVASGLLSTLKITPPTNDASDFQLGLSVKVLGITTQIGLLNVRVDAVADAPTLTVTGSASVTENHSIPLTITGALTDTDGSETLSYAIKGLPAGATLSAGHYNALTGDWDLKASEVANLTLTPPTNYSGTLNLQVVAISSELEGNYTSTSKSLSVTVTPVTQQPILTITPSTGAEHTPIALHVGAALGDTDGSEHFTTILVSGLPAGATLNHGTSLGGGVYSLTTADLTGLTVTPPTGYSGTLNLTVSATAQDGTAATATTTGTLALTVTAVADAPTLTLPTTPVAVTAGAATALNIAGALVDTDGSERLSVTIGNVPTGAVLSAGLNNGDGTWILTAAQLAGLKVTLPSTVTSDVNLTVTAHALETSTGSAADTTSTVTLHVTPAAAGVHLAALDTATTEDTAVALTLGVSTDNLDANGHVSVTVTGLASDAVLNHGTHNADGSWTLTTDDLAGLTLTPGHNDASAITAHVAATATTGAGVISTTSGDVHIAVMAVADAPTLQTTDTSGSNNGPIALNIQSALVDTDGSENLHVTVGGLPVGAMLTAGTDNHDGTWTLQSSDLAHVSLVPSGTETGTLALTVTATAQEANGNTASTTSLLHVAVADSHNLATDGLLASGLSLSAVSGQTVSHAIVSLDPLAFHTGDSLSLAGLQLDTTADGRTMIASTNIEVVGGGFDSVHHSLTLAGDADASTYQSVLQALNLNAGADNGTRAISIDLYDQGGAHMALGHFDLSHTVGTVGDTLTALSTTLSTGLDTTFDSSTSSSGLDSAVADPFSGSSTVDTTVHHDTTIHTGF
ncbi:Ig-like domain-containing protein, partial [Nitrospirillum amazonense]|uniref:Ig-like domain-containing protein n=1 Tax=Nitrospirillum amazonense TaxID=28077 RepID=UPI001646CEFD